jgi:purine-nucleoside phosphorylase
MQELQQVNEAANYIKSRVNFTPDYGIVLGSGLGGLVSEINEPIEISYDQILGFPKATVQGHAGKLIFGNLGGKSVVAMQGRFHYYEGHSMNKVTFPIRVFKSLGVHTLLQSNAAGGLDPNHAVGDLMLITDHINLMGTNPLIGPNVNEWGPRFPDMSEVYDIEYYPILESLALQAGIATHRGVYAGVTGPTFETPAEYKMLSILGAHAVGMSTVPESIVAAHCGIKCLAFSIISDLGVAGKIEKISHAEVLKAVQDVEKRLKPVIVRFFEKLP